MTGPPEDTWLVPDPLSPERLQAALAAAFRVQALPEYGAEVTYVDSFDWRLYQAGMLLHTHGHSWTLYESSGKLTLLRGGPLCRRSCTLEAFPEGAMRSALAPVLGLRALLPLTRVDLRGRQLHLCNEAGDIMLRLVWEEQRLLESAQSFRMVRLFPLRGHRQALDAARSILRHTGIVQPVSPLAGFEAGCRAAGRIPLDYSSKFPQAIARDMQNLRALDALRLICLHLLTGIRRNVPGVLGDWDTVFLHDLRVALRRTRTALAMGRDLFPAGTLDVFRSGFAELGRATGATRDLDSFLLGEAKYADRLPAELRPGLHMAFAGIARERARVRRVLVRRLKNEKTVGLLQDWEDFWQQAGQGDGAADAGGPVRALSDRMLRRHGRKVLAAGSGITESSLDAELHQLRVACKKLRYTLEFFRALYPEEEARSVIHTLKEVQGILGRLHDGAVARQLALDWLGSVQAAGENSGSGQNSALAGAAMTRIAEELRLLRPALLARFKEAFSPLAGRLGALAPFLEPERL